MNLEPKQTVEIDPDELANIVDGLQHAADSIEDEYTCPICGPSAEAVRRARDILRSWL